MMKFCSKCGKEILEEAVICPGCGCAVEKETKAKEVSYDDCIKGTITTNIISVIIIVFGIVCWLFVSMWIGAFLCLIAELLALSPNSKVQKAFKKNGLIGKTKEAKEKRAAIIKDLKAKSSAYSFSKVLAIIALVLLIVFVLLI